MSIAPCPQNKGMKKEDEDFLFYCFDILFSYLHCQDHARAKKLLARLLKKSKLKPYN